MSTGALAVVEEWLDAVNRRHSDRVEDLSDEAVEVAGPRGTVRGRQILSGWLTRAGFSAEPLRWFCGGSSMEPESRATSDTTTSAWHWRPPVSTRATRSPGRNAH